MKKIVVFILIIFLVNSCQKDENKIHEAFEIKGQLINNSKKFEKIYLGYEFYNGFYLADSSDIDNDTFKFKGKIAYPQKAQLLFYELGQPFAFILTGEKIKLQLDAQDMTRSKYANSPINDEFQQLKYQSVAINNTIDYLYPQIQKARLENDSETLKKLIIQIREIENKNSKFLLDYISKHPKTRLAALLLNDLYHSGYTDTLALKKTARLIQPELKKTLTFEP